MEGRVEELRQKLDRLIRDAAEASVTLDWAEGTIQGVPHYTLIEAPAHQLGRQLSCAIQERQLNEVWRGRRRTPSVRDAACVVT